MKKALCLSLALAASLALVGCDDEAKNTSSAPQQVAATSTDVQKSTDGSKILVAYYSYVDNTDAANIKSAQYDVMTAASILVRDDKRIGVSAVMAGEMARLTGADVFSIQNETPYPASYDETVQQAKDERDRGVKLPIKNHVTDTSSYDTVILVIPVWWYDVPVAFETFLEETDLSGKKIYVTGSSGGSELDACVDTVKRLAPQAASVEKGVFLVKSETQNPEKPVADWLKSIGLAK